MRILVLNCGSSSIKFQLFDMAGEQRLISGLLERIGEAQPRLNWRCGDRRQSRDCLAGDHHQGLERIIGLLGDLGWLEHPEQLAAVGHRVVHGGERFRQPVLIDDEVLRTIEQMVPLAPLHNPANLEGIRVARALCPKVPQVAVFDTAFHQGMPEAAYRYPLPEACYREHHVRRYGFHGTSHHYVAKEAARYLEQPLENLSLITLHLGNGCSAAAIRGGHSIDTSMGMTPLEGLMMGSRCGDLDPALHFYLQRQMGLDNSELEHLLNKQSGLKGVAGVSDMREVQQRAGQGDTRADLARNMFAYRIRKYIGAYAAVLGRLDALIFTGGIGENDSWTREACCRELEILGLQLDDGLNVQGGAGIRQLQRSDSRVKILVVPTNEELEIARCAREVVAE